MNGEANGASFAIEIRARYEDVARDRWPVAVDPLPDELLSSWIHRLALANGIAPQPFASVLGLNTGMWSPRLDLRLPHPLAMLLGNQTDLPAGKIAAMALTGWALTPLVLPLRQNAHRGRSTWMQYCPLCLAADEAPYFRRQWRLAPRISCFVHRCGLRDRCPACRSGIVAFDQRELVPQHFCARCGFDLRKAAKVSVKAAARRLEQAVADICRVELAKGSPTITDLISRLLRAPAVARAPSTNILTGLSTSARIRCFELLADKSAIWAAADTTAAVMHARQHSDGGRPRRIDRWFCGFHGETPKSSHSRKTIMDWNRSPRPLRGL
ncbi:TniQ family protein [Brucella endophytica]|uniref:TniQ family protein n=1 Tax=Brucella endophytica TaxID=1963359 RepID=UPI001F27122B|nr:TniQ family protein [Brucella endophytica]